MRKLYGVNEQPMGPKVLCTAWFLVQNFLHFLSILMINYLVLLIPRITTCSCHVHVGGCYRCLDYNFTLLSISKTILPWHVWKRVLGYVLHYPTYIACKRVCRLFWRLLRATGPPEVILHFNPWVMTYLGIQSPVVKTVVLKLSEIIAASGISSGLSLHIRDRLGEDDALIKVERGQFGSFKVLSFFKWPLSGKLYTRRFNWCQN